MRFVLLFDNLSDPNQIDPIATKFYNSQFSKQKTLKMIQITIQRIQRKYKSHPENRTTMDHLNFVNNQFYVDKFYPTIHYRECKQTIQRNNHCEERIPTQQIH